MLILHGDNNILSRQTLVDLKVDAVRNHQNIIEYSGFSLTLSQLSQAVEATTLLGEANMVIVSDYFIRRSGKEKTNVAEGKTKISKE